MVKGGNIMGMKFDPTVNLGHVLTAAAMLATGFAAYGTLEKRVSLQEERSASAASLANERAASTKDALVEIKSDVKELKRTVDSFARGK